MARICSMCGKKIGFLADPLELGKGFLCDECAEPISEDISDLYALKSKARFYEESDRIIEKSKGIYSAEIVDDISQRIELIHNDIACWLKDDLNKETSKAENTDKDKTVKNNDFVLKIKDEQNGSIYDEIGKKVKTLAKVTCIVEAVLSVISGFIMIATDEEYILVGLIAMVVGPIVAWVSSWVLYAFGELVDKTCANEQHNKELLEIMKENYKK